MLAVVVAPTVNVTSIVCSHCSLVACVVVSCLDFPIVACSAAGSSDEVTACSAAGSRDEVPACSAAGSRDELAACSAHVDVASLARVPASLGCLSASAASAAASAAVLSLVSSCNCRCAFFSWSHRSAGTLIADG